MTSILNLMTYCLSEAGSQPNQMSANLNLTRDNNRRQSAADDCNDTESVDTIVSFIHRKQAR